MRGVSTLALLASTCLYSTSNAITLDITDDESIKSAASTIAYGAMKYYTGNHTGDVPGNLPDPYYWWEAGALFGVMVDYWYYTNDTTYNDVTQQALLWQAGDDYNFMPTNQTKTEGNDDQGFWGMAAMTAAENKFQDPPDSDPGWLALAQAVFNTMAARWDDTTCNGGLRWQIFTFNSGYNYKNAIANGCFFNIGARLAAYTGNATYTDWAEKTWDWVESIGLIGTDYSVYDGSQDTDNCSTIDHGQWTYNQGIYLYGAAMMWKATNESDIWKQRVDGLLNATDYFFESNVMYERSCEGGATGCNNDQQSFKAYLSRWMWATAKLCPWTYDTIYAKLSVSAAAAAEQCSGGTDGVTCGLKWTQGATWDGLYGVGEQMAALQVIGGLLVQKAADTVTNSTGGTSKGNSAAGSGTATTAAGLTAKKTTTGDRVGAGFLTTAVVIGIVGGVSFMIL